MLAFFLEPWVWALYITLALAVFGFLIVSGNRMAWPRVRKASILPCSMLIITSVHCYGPSRVVQAKVERIQSVNHYSSRHGGSHEVLIYLTGADGQDYVATCRDAGGIVAHDEVTATVRTLLWTDISELGLTTPDTKSGAHNRPPSGLP